MAARLSAEGSEDEKSSSVFVQDKARHYREPAFEQS